MNQNKTSGSSIDRQKRIEMIKNKDKIVRTINKIKNITEKTNTLFLKEGEGSLEEIKSKLKVLEEVRESIRERIDFLSEFEDIMKADDVIKMLEKVDEIDNEIKKYKRDIELKDKIDNNLFKKVDLFLQGEVHYTTEEKGEIIAKAKRECKENRYIVEKILYNKQREITFNKTKKITSVYDGAVGEKIKNNIKNSDQIIKEYTEIIEMIDSNVTRKRTNKVDEILEIKKTLNTIVTNMHKENEEFVKMYKENKRKDKITNVLKVVSGGAGAILFVGCMYGGMSFITSVGVAGVTTVGLYLGVSQIFKKKKN